MKELLTIYTYIDGVNDVPFYDSQNPIQVSEYTASMQRMSSCSISATIEYPVCLDNEWDGRQYVTFRGERWFLKNIPSSSYSNESGLYSHSLQFSPERELQLGNVYFYDAVTADSDVDDKYKSNSSKVVFFGTIQEFAARLAASLKYVGLTEYSVVVDDDVESEALQIEFEDRTFFEALQDGYDNYNIPFYFVGKVIHFGYTDDVIDQTFKYGVDNELLSIKKENANYKIVTRCAGYGSSDNVPYYYPNNSPKGNIGVQVLAGSPTLGEGNIHIIDYATFAAKVEIGERVEFHEGKTGTMGIFVNDEEEMYDGQPREVHLVNLMPIDVKFRILFSISGDGQFKITPTMTLAGSVINPLAGIITDVSLIDYSTKESKGVEIVDYDHIVTDSLDGDVYEMTLKYTLRDVGGLGDYTYSTWFTIEPMPGSWKIGESEDAISVDISKLGIKIDVTPSSGDAFTQVLINKITESEYLLPPVYRDTLGAERFYNAINDTYTNPETGEKYVFENEYNAKTPHEHIEEFEDIKPTIKGITNAAGQEIGRFLEVAYDLNDNDDTDEDGNYLHPYFFVKLPKFDGDWGFNLFDHAIENGEMTIAMTSGNCGGCHFVIGVNEVDGKSNIVQVDEDGNLKRDSEGNVLWKGQFAQDVQNDTQNNEVWIALKKDIDTFGVVMPNATNNYKPSAGDSFVILNILLPQAYIDKAENDLKEAIIQYMSENNSEKFNFSIGFSRIYLAENPDIEKRLTENARIKVEYNGSVYTFYISQVSYKAESDVTLPEISVELADTITINRSALQNSIDSVEFKVTKKFDNINFVSKVSPYFIKKNEDDETRGIVRFIRGLRLGENTSENRGFVVGNTNTVTGTLDALTLLGIKDGVSLSVPKGYIAGLRPFVRRVTESRELTNLDYTILVGAASAITLTTPQSPENGQYYRIYNDSAYPVSISGNGSLISIIGDESQPAETMTLDKTSGMDMFFSKDVGRWFVTFFSDAYPLIWDDAQSSWRLDGNLIVTGSLGVGSASQGSGSFDLAAMWEALAGNTVEQINVSHLPIDDIASSLEENGYSFSITKEMVEAVLTGTITSHNHDGRYAPLSDGIIPSQYLPSFVDDVVEYSSKSAFPSVGESGKIYVATDTNLTYRWSGSTYTEISPSLALGYTSSTAYPGNEGAANAAAIKELQKYFTDGAVNKLAHTLTIGGKSFDGSAELVISLLGGQSGAGDINLAMGANNTISAALVGKDSIFTLGSQTAAFGGKMSAIKGVSSISLEGNDSVMLTWDDTNSAWKLNGSLIVTGSLTAGEAGSGSGGGYTQYEWEQIKELTATVAGGLASAYAVKQAYDALAAMATDVSFSQGISGGISLGVITIDNAAQNIYAPGNLGAYSNDVGFATQTWVTQKGYITGITSSMVTSALGYTPLNASLFTLSGLGITATAAELNKLDGLSTTAKELGYVHGVTSSIQTQLDSKASASALSGYLPLIGGTMSGSIEIPTGTYIYGVSRNEAGGGMLGFVDGHTQIGSIGESTTSATHIRSITGHATIGTESSALYNILDSGNYTNYTVTKTGAGASGTWAISISGKAASASAVPWSGVQNRPPLEWDATNNVWKFSSNLIVTGSLANGEAGAGGSGGYSQYEWPQIKNMSATIQGALASAYSVKQAYDELADKATAVSFSQSVSSGKLLGVITIDGKATNIYTPSNLGAYTNDAGYIKNLAGLGITATAAEINKLDGLATTATELGYVHGVTSSIQTQLNSKANASALASYALKDGSNASGSWGINITGSAKYLSSTYIQDNADLNDYTTSGMYYCGSDAVVQTMSNCPTTNAFSLLVEHHAGAKQTLTEYYITNPRTWFRNYYNGNWGSWYSIPFAGAVNVGSSANPVYVSNDKILACSYSFGNASGNAALNNGNLNKSLNADLLDGLHSTSFPRKYTVGQYKDYVQKVIGIIKISDNTSNGCAVSGSISTFRNNGIYFGSQVHFLYSTIYNSSNAGTTCRLGRIFLGSIDVLKPCTFTYNGKKYAGFVFDYSSASTTNFVVTVDNSFNAPDPFVVEFYNSSTKEVLNEEVKSSLVINGSDIEKQSGYFPGGAVDRLATPRSLWGQFFDGTKDISGDMTGIGDIRMSGSLATVSSGRNVYLNLNGIRYCADITSSWAMSLSPYNHDNTENLGHAIAGVYGNFDTVNYTYYGGSWDNPAIAILPNLNVGIGTRTPTRKLHVNGDLGCNGGFCNGRWYIQGGNLIEFDTSAGNTAGMIGVVSNDFKFYDNTAWRTIWHAGNSNLKTVDWAAKNLTLAGTIGGVTSITMSQNIYMTNPDLRIFFGKTSGAFITGNSSLFKICSHSNQSFVADLMRLDMSGNATIIGNCQVNGSLANGQALSSSDIRLKTNIAKISEDKALSTIKRLKPVTWTWNDKSSVKGNDAGFVAQAVREVLPDAVKESGEYLTLEYNQLSAYIIAALQVIMKKLGI